jgi:hypothetical protein
MISTNISTENFDISEASEIVQVNEKENLIAQLQTIFAKKPEEEQTRPTTELIKENIYFAREEITLLIDLTDRIIQGIAADQEDPHIRFETLEKTPTVSTKINNEMIQYVYQEKKLDIARFSEHLRTSFIRLQKITSSNQKFFGNLAFELLNNHWVLQERMWGRTLYVDYGFQGAVFSEPSEADLWRFSVKHKSEMLLNSEVSIESNEKLKDEQVEMFNPHLNACHTHIGVFASTEDISFHKSAKRLPLNNLNSTEKILAQLENSRENIFEKELFKKIMAEITLDQKLAEKCHLTFEEIVIPIRNYFFVCTLKDYSKSRDMDLNLEGSAETHHMDSDLELESTDANENMKMDSTETRFRMTDDKTKYQIYRLNTILATGVRLKLLRSFDQNTLILPSILESLQYSITLNQVESIISSIRELFHSVLPLKIKRLSNLEHTTWQLEFKSRLSLSIQCELIKNGTLTIKSEIEGKSHEIASLLNFKRVLKIYIRSFLEEIVRMECVMFFGLSSVMKLDNRTKILFANHKRFFIFN